MEKTLALEVLRKGHLAFEEALKEIVNKNITDAPIIGIWPIKDVIAHLTAWYIEFIEEIDSFLIDKPIINLPSGDDAFNSREVAKRKEAGFNEVVYEWRESFDALIQKLNSLSDSEWNHKCKGYFWPDGTEISIQSLFASFADTNTSHEGEHAKQIKEFLNNQNLTQETS